jgi:phage recombination protein Bet
VANENNLVQVMSDRFGMLPDEFKRTCKSICFPDGKATDEQFYAFLAIARGHDLNPFTREIYAFPRPHSGIQTIVSVDGWMKIINSHPQFDGMEFEDKVEAGKLLAITCRIYRKDRRHPVECTEYLRECIRQTEPWQKWPARMLRHKAAIQAARYAFGFAGIIDPDESQRFEETGAIETTSVKVKEDEPWATPTAKGSAQPQPVTTAGAKTAGAEAQVTTAARVAPSAPIRMVPRMEEAESFEKKTLAQSVGLMDVGDDAEGKGTNLSQQEAEELAAETAKMLPRFSDQRKALQKHGASSYEDLTRENWRSFIQTVQEMAGAGK